MDKKILQGVTLVGMWQAVQGLAVGAVFLIYGFNAALSDILLFVAGGGGNQSGLLFIFGAIVSGIGIFFLRGARSAVLLMRGNPNGRRLAVKFFCISTPVLVFVPILWWFLPVTVNTNYWKIFISILNVASLVFLIHPRVKEQFTFNGDLTPQEKRIFNLLIAVLLALGTVQAVKFTLDWHKKITSERPK